MSEGAGMDPWVVFGWVAALSASLVVAALAVVIVIAAVQGLRPKAKDTATVVIGKGQN